MKTVCCAVLIWLCIVTVTYAANVNVRYEKKTYYLSAEFNVEASPTRVMQVLNDYENISDLNPAITVSELLASPDESTLRVRTVVHDCILFFCKDITRVEDIQQEGNEKLEAFMIPMLSDLRSGYASWALTENPLGTTVRYEANMQPKFWVPPIIRSFVLTKKFKKRVTESIQLLQNKAVNDN